MIDEHEELPSEQEISGDETGRTADTQIVERFPVTEPKRKKAA